MDAMLAPVLLARHPQLAAPDLEARLRALVESARSAWPTVALDDATFIAHVAAHLPEGDGAASALDALHSADLYLACACAQRLPSAIVAFEREHLARVEKTVRRIDSRRDFVDDVRQALRERLLVGAPARIAMYSGSGPLHGWVRVAGTRLALNTLRAAKRRADLHPDATPERDLERDLVNGHYSAEVEVSFRKAFARLPEEYRELLRLHYLDGWTQERIAEQHRLDRSTLSRRLSAARRFLLSAARGELQRLVPAMTTASRDSLLMALRSQIDLNLESMLQR
jgi:RNA polymerase sigma-70 factor (ECF subfamily)